MKQLLISGFEVDCSNSGHFRSGLRNQIYAVLSGQIDCGLPEWLRQLRPAWLGVPNWSN
jgi:hypothetical protein